MGHWFAQASLLEYARGIAEAYADRRGLKRCVLTVPPFFGQGRREALADAARLAGLRCGCGYDNNAVGSSTDVSVSVGEDVWVSVPKGT